MTVQDIPSKSNALPTFPNLPGGQSSAANLALLDVQDIECVYGFSGVWSRLFSPSPKSTIKDVSFSIGAQETFALVGESGSGKTTIARTIAGLLVPVRGQILFDGQDITASVDRRSKEFHRQIQIIFQNPDASLNPRHRIVDILGRPLEFFFGLSESARRERIEELLHDVDLNAGYMQRFPAQLSGGERQRVAIARALAAEPKLVLCDEIVSALDVSVQANLLDLLRRLQQARGITYLFISHDLAVVRWLARRVGVLYLGQLMEIGTVEEVFSPPFHPYTEILLQSVPEPIPGLTRASAALEPALDSDEIDLGCPFSSRCRYRGEGCSYDKPPAWQSVSPTHAIYCHIPATELLRAQSLTTVNHRTGQYIS